MAGPADRRVISVATGRPGAIDRAPDARRISNDGSTGLPTKSINFAGNCGNNVAEIAET